MECVRYRVELKIGDEIVMKDYTALIPIQVLKHMDERFKEHFEGKKKYNIHVTPLLDEEGKAIYPKVVVKCSFCRDKKPKGIKHVHLPKRVAFEVAVPKDTFDMRTVEGTIKVDDEEVQFEVIGIKKVDTEVRPSKTYSILFRGPSLLVDPYARPGDPLNLRFLFDLYILFYTDLVDLNLGIEMRDILNYNLVEDHSSSHSLGKVWYLENGRWLPGLSGSLFYRVRGELDERVLKVLNHANCMGVGGRRDEGFGDVIIGPDPEGVKHLSEV